MATIRHATIEDCPRLMELIRELAEFERAPHEVTVDENHFVESGFGTHPVWWALVAEERDEQETGSDTRSQTKIVGFALYFIRYSTWKGQRMYLEDIIVTQEARGRGIGTLLMQAIIDEARKKNFTGVFWQVLDWNQPAIDFYKKFGAKFDPEWTNCFIPF